MSLTSYDARTGRGAPAGEETPPAGVDRAVSQAAEAAPAVAAASPAERAAWLDHLGSALRGERDRLVELADAETALGVSRLTGEVDRMVSQLSWYGAEARTGRYLGVVREDPIVRVGRPLGVVAVFGASNFPFAFGLLGNDTASALAAGCPVVAKHHPAHPRTSAALAETATSALAEAGAPAGTFAAVAGLEAGAQLVGHPSISAVGFTGSQRGGMALVEIAARREVVIPVYAEMGTVNPVVVTAAAAAARSTEIARGFVDSFTLGSGQFCTKPGLLLAPVGSGLTERVGEALQAAAPSPVMLTSAIATAAKVGVAELIESGASLVSSAHGPASGWAAAAAVLSVSPADLRPGSRLLEECFGPVALVAEVTCDERDRVLGDLQGALSAAVATAGPDDPELPGLVEALASKVGRVIVDGWPTGVLTSAAQHHGGPWPATSRPDATSVGGGALARWVRPVAYQQCPESALPPAGRSDNPWGVRQDVREVTG